jgi:hypothetical protein
MDSIGKDLPFITTINDLLSHAPQSKTLPRRRIKSMELQWPTSSIDRWYVVGYIKHRHYWLCPFESAHRIAQIYIRCRGVLGDTNPNNSSYIMRRNHQDNDDYWTRISSIVWSAFWAVFERKE